MNDQATLEPNPLTRLVEIAVANGKDSNNIFTEANILACFQSHYVNPSKPEVAGIKCLIAEILITGFAYAAPGSENPILPDGMSPDSPEAIQIRKQHRKEFAKRCFTTAEVKQMVDARYADGSSRYSFDSVKAYLSAIMPKAGLLCKWRLESDEDATRKCKTTHVLYYLSTEPPTMKTPKRGFRGGIVPKPVSE